MVLQRRSVAPSHNCPTGRRSSLTVGVGAIVTASVRRHGCADTSNVGLAMVLPHGAFGMCRYTLFEPCHTPFQHP